MISDAYAAAAGHAESAGVPQFEPSFFQHQIVWSVISFAILLYLLNKHVLPAINDLLDARSKKIEDDLASAELARNEAKRAQENLNGQLTAAHQMATETMEQARVDAVNHREQALKELTAELEKKRVSAIAEIENAKKKALAEVQSVVVEVAMMATEKLIAKTVNKTIANAMVEEALQDIKANKSNLH